MKRVATLNETRAVTYGFRHMEWFPEILWILSRHVERCLVSPICDLLRPISVLHKI